MVCRLDAADRGEVISALAGRLAEVDPAVDPAYIERVALAREEIESTGIGDGVALPHARTDGVASTRLCVATLARPVAWDSYDSDPVRVVFLILGSRKAPAHQLRVLADVSALVRTPGFIEALYAAEDSGSMYGALRSASTRQA
jgi:mannitol/fructose-specific phosphotransferase system IIA component (Ntr-type)